MPDPKFEELRAQLPPQPFPIAHPDLVFFSEIVIEREFLPQDDVDPEIAQRIDSLQGTGNWVGLERICEGLPELRRAYDSRDPQEWRRARPKLLEMMAEFSEYCSLWVPSILRPIFWRHFWEGCTRHPSECVPLRWQKLPPAASEKSRVPTSQYNWRFGSMEVWNDWFWTIAWDGSYARHLLMWCDVRATPGKALGDMLADTKRQLLGPGRSKKFSYKRAIVERYVGIVDRSLMSGLHTWNLPGFDALKKAPEYEPEQIREAWRRYVRHGEVPEVVVQFIQAMANCELGIKPPPVDELVERDESRLDRHTVTEALRLIFEDAKKNPWGPWFVRK